MSNETMEWEVEIINGRMIVDGRVVGAADEIVRNQFGYEVDGSTVAEYIAGGGVVFFREDGCWWANE